MVQRWQERTGGLRVITVIYRQIQMETLFRCQEKFWNTYPWKECSSLKMKFLHISLIHIWNSTVPPGAHNGSARRRHVGKKKHCSAFVKWSTYLPIFYKRYSFDFIILADRLWELRAQWGRLRKSDICVAKPLKREAQGSPSTADDSIKVSLFAQRILKAAQTRLKSPVKVHCMSSNWFEKTCLLECRVPLISSFTSMLHVKGQFWPQVSSLPFVISTWTSSIRDTPTSEHTKPKSDTTTTLTNE